MSVNEKMMAIADNIRDKTGGTEALTLDDMASGVNEVYQAGKKAEYNEFWESGGLRPDHRFKGTFWTKETFKPNKDFEIGAQGFSYHNWQGTAYDLAEHLESLGVRMTLTSSADQELFNCAWFTRLPELNFSPCSGTFDRVFRGMSLLVTIDKIVLPDEGAVTSFNQPFNGCSRLKNVLFDGILDKEISFSDCPLSADSVESIARALKDFSISGTAYSCTLTIKSASLNSLETSGKIPPSGSTWAEYIDNKKWNLTLS